MGVSRGRHIVRLTTIHYPLPTVSMPAGLDRPLCRQESEEVAAGAETGDLADDDRADEGVVAELLARVDIAQVYFDGRQAHGGDGVAEGDAGVGVGRGID